MLEAKDLSVFYGRHRALEKVSVHVDRGEICVILGANGAGKSTLLKVIAGLTRCESGGAVLVNGAAIASAKPSMIVEHGIALVPESGAIFGELTVAENLMLGAYPTRARGREAENRGRVYRLFPVLSERRRQIARTMSGGEQKMLAVGRALMSEPDVLMLDEPSLGLSPLLTTELFKALKAIGESGVGILLVEQNANQSLKIADRGYLLENGHIVGEDSAMALASDPAVRHAYLGVDTEAERPRYTAPELLPPLPLAGLNAVEISKRAGELAAHAAAVHAAYVASARRLATPGALAGRADGHTNAHVESSSRSPADAAELSRMAGALAERASEIHAAHIRSRHGGERSPTLPAPATSAPGSGQAPLPSTASSERLPDLSTLTRMAEAFAQRAAGSPRSLNGGSETGRTGDEAQPPGASQASSGGARPADRQATALSASAEELAAHAAAVHARYVAASRDAGAAHCAFGATHISGTKLAATTRSKKHKKGKKKSKKSRKRCGRSKGD